MKFDFAIGNPAYNESFTQEGNETYAAPVYHKFIDAACEIADRVEMVHPARFLFNAGSTPKAWNEKMLSDPHYKVLDYEEDCRKLFSNTEIKGGIAITYHDNNKDFGAIGVFTQYAELNSILKKTMGSESMSTIVITRTAYRLTDKLHKDFPNAVNQLSKGHAYDMSTNIFERLPQVFFNRKPEDGFEYIEIVGREGNERTTKYIRKEYVNEVVNLYSFKLLLPKANNTGAFGETLTLAPVYGPGVGSTESFISVGIFDKEYMAKNVEKYIRTKFARAMLGILKKTQDLTPEKWKHVPLQDFTDKSDINWSTSIKKIDQQLYKKYNLTEEEIEFIETHVKEME